MRGRSRFASLLLLAALLGGRPAAGTGLACPHRLDPQFLLFGSAAETRLRLGPALALESRYIENVNELLAGPDNWCHYGGQCMQFAPKLRRELITRGLAPALMNLDHDFRFPVAGGWWIYGAYHFFLVEPAADPELELFVDPTYLQFFLDPEKVIEKEHGSVFIGFAADLRALYVRYAHLIKKQDLPIALSPVEFAEMNYGLGAKRRYRQISHWAYH
jgi:hypothetical protein